MSIEVVRVKRLGDARYAQCLTCNQYMEPSLFWGLDKVIHLHRTGSGSKQCKIILFGYKEATS